MHSLARQILNDICLSDNRNLKLVWIEERFNPITCSILQFNPTTCIYWFVIVFVFIVLISLDQI